MSSPERDGGFLHYAKIIGVGGLAVIGGLTAYNKAVDVFPSLPDMPELNFDFGNNPPAAEAAVIPATYSEEATFDISCLARMAVGVAVHGNKDEFVAGGELDKVYFGDFLLCGDSSDKAMAQAVIERDKTTNEVLSVSMVTDGLKVTHPRIDHEDSRNCAPLRPNDSINEINKKIADWKKDKRAGKNPECDDGFDISGFWAFGGDLSKIKETGFAAAQIAMALDAQPQKQIDKMNQQFIAELKSEMIKRYPGADVTVTLRDRVSQVEQRLKDVAEDLKDNDFDVKFDEKDGKPIMKVSAPGGGDVTVKVQSVQAGAVNIGRISKVIDVPDALGSRE